jgi:hypothetical protein
MFPPHHSTAQPRFFQDKYTIFNVKRKEIPLKGKGEYFTQTFDKMRGAGSTG